MKNKTDTIRLQISNKIQKVCSEFYPLFCYNQSIKLASHADVLRGSSSVPASQTSVESSGKKRRPITALIQIWEIHFGP